MIDYATRLKDGIQHALDMGIDESAEPELKLLAEMEPEWIEAPDSDGYWWAHDPAFGESLFFVKDGSPTLKGEQVPIEQFRVMGVVWTKAFCPKRPRKS